MGSNWLKAGMDKLIDDGNYIMGKSIGGWEYIHIIWVNSFVDGNIRMSYCIDWMVFKF